MASNVVTVKKPGKKPGTVTSKTMTVEELSDDQLQQISVYGDGDPAALAERIKRRSAAKGGGLSGE